MSKPFENLEKSIAELERNWENVVIRYISEESHTFTHDIKLSKTDTPKELFDKLVVKFEDGITLINLPDWNFEWACSVIAIAFEKTVCGLDEQLAIYRHNLKHPNKNVAWKTYTRLKALKK